jgi:hypothetical protein
MIHSNEWNMLGGPDDPILDDPEDELALVNVFYPKAEHNLLVVNGQFVTAHDHDPVKGHTIIRTFRKNFRFGSLYSCKKDSILPKHPLTTESAIQSWQDFKQKYPKLSTLYKQDPETN